MTDKMSAIGPKRTSLVAPHMSAFGGKADAMIAPRMSACDQKPDNPVAGRLAVVAPKGNFASQIGRSQSVHI
jgi:hypothetical protein